MQPETCITHELNNIFRSIHDRKKSVVPRDVILLIKKLPPPNLNPAEKNEAMGSGAPKTIFLQTAAGLSAGGEVQ